MTIAGTSPTHGQFTIERRYPQPVDKVFAAFADLDTKRRWFAEGEGFEVDHYEMDFREGGFERCDFRASDGNAGRNVTVYLDIVPNERIVTAYTMDYGGARISSSLLTIALRAEGKGTLLTLTEQGMYLPNSDGVAGREAGTKELLEALGRQLGG